MTFMGGLGFNEKESLHRKLNNAQESKVLHPMHTCYVILSEKGFCLFNQVLCCFNKKNMLMIVVVIRSYTRRSGGVVDRGRDERGTRLQSTLPFHRKGDNKSPQNVSCAIPSASELMSPRYGMLRLFLLQGFLLKTRLNHRWTRMSEQNRLEE